MYLCKILENPILIHTGSTILNIRLEEFRVVPVFVFRVDSEDYKFTGILPRLANINTKGDLIVLCAVTKETIKTIEQVVVIGNKLTLESYGITNNTVVLPFKKLKDNYYLNLKEMYIGCRDPYAIF